MREIKFRFWNKIARRFQPASKYAIDGEGKLVSYDYEMMAYDDPVDFSKTIIVAQQYTGLKDNNGKEIYEGDIIHYKFDGASYPKEACDLLLTCIYCPIFGGYIFNAPNDSYYYAEIRSYDEVIGNIFETPELLEK
jgi:uncharacterized phage protein (TIGR01671 family)